MSKKLKRNSFVEGLAMFLNILPDVIADYPKMIDQLSTVIATLLDLKIIGFNEISLNEMLGKDQKLADEDKPIVEDYYRLIANLLLILSKKEDSSPNKLKKMFDYSPLFKQFKEMKSMIIE